MVGESDLYQLGVNLDHENEKTWEKLAQLESAFWVLYTRKDIRKKQTETPIQTCKPELPYMAWTTTYMQTEHRLKW